MAEAETNQVLLQVSEESQWGEDPSTPSMAKCRFTGGIPIHNKDTVESATIRAGVATGSNLASISVGDPSLPERIAISQKALVEARWTATSRADHPSQRLGWDHSSSSRSWIIARKRRRCRMHGSATAAGSPSSAMIAVGS